MDGLFTAIGMLTVAPIPWVSMRPGALGRAAMWFPVVGVMIGAGLAAIAVVGQVVWGDRWVAASLVVGLNVVLTGGLHIDGLMDSADAFFSRGSRERMLEVMHDSRAGALGVSAGVVALLVRLCATSHLMEPGRLRLLAVIAVGSGVGRLGIVAAAVFFPSAREDGLGAAFAAEVRPLHMLVAAMWALLIAGTIWGVRGLLLVGLGVLVALLLGLYWRGRLGGLTGDIYGAVNESVELALLLAAGYLMRLG